MDSPAVKESHLPDEIVSDTSNSLLNDRSETPDSSRGPQDNDSVTSSPRISKPVLGKAQAKKRLMAFAKFNASVKQSLEKLKEKNQTLKDTDLKKSKLENPKEPQDPSKVFRIDDLSESSVPDVDPEKQNVPKKFKKRSEKKLAAIEEIMREESMQKQLITQESLEKAVALDKFQLRHQAEPRLREFNKRYRENRFRGWEDRRFAPRFDRKSPFSRQNDNRKSPYNRRRRNSSEKRDNDRRDRKERRRSKSNDEDKEKEKEKSVDPESKKEKSKKGENWEDFRSQWVKERPDWVDFDTTRAPPVELRSRSAQEYRSSWEQMLMTNNARPQRSCVIINGIDDSQREYPPESIRITRRFNKGLFYSENPNIAMNWNRRRLYQVLPPDRCRLMREISEQQQNVEAYEAPRVRNWYKRIDSNGRLEIVRSSAIGADDDESGANVCAIPPKSRWEVEPEEVAGLADDDVDGQLDNEAEDEKSTLEEGEISREDIADDEKEAIVEEKVPEELASEYEEFMKIVGTEGEIPAETSSPKVCISPEIDENKKIEEEQMGELRESSVGERVGEEENGNEEFVEREEKKRSRNKSKSRVYHKKKLRKRVSSSETSDSSSSSESEAERRRKRKRKRKKKRARDSSTDSSSSEDSSSDERISKRRKKSSKRRKKAKRSKLRKKRSRRDSSDSESSDSSEREERYRKKKKKRRIFSKRSKSSKKSRSRSSEKLKLRKIKIEIDEDIPLEKSPIKAPEIPDASPKGRIIIKLEKEKPPNVFNQKETSDTSEPSKPSEISLEKGKIWEKKPLIDTDSEKLATIPIPEETPQVLKPEEIPLPLSPKDPKKFPTSEEPEEQRKHENTIICKKQKKRRSTSTSSTSSSDSTSSYTSTSSSSSSSKASSSRHRRKKHYSSKPSSDRSHNRRKNAEKGMRRSKSKWVTEFDFDFPSLMQLEQNTPAKIESSGPVDDWEVDSLEDIRDFASSYVKEKSKKGKKIEKEVRYDEKTDTYIAVEKECPQESPKKLPGRVCALRIWEDEEEEGEREAALMEKTEKVIEWQEPVPAPVPVPVPPIELTKEADPVLEEAGEKAEEWTTDEVPEKRKTPELAICADPPTPDGPLVPVNWEEEEEWTTSLTHEIKPVQPPESSQLKANIEIEAEKIDQDIDVKPEPEKSDVPDDKDKLYSPSSAADSQKSEEGSSESSESSTDSSSTTESSESDAESKGEKKKIKDVEIKTPVSPVPPSNDDFMIEKAKDAGETLQQLKMDMLLQMGGRDFVTTESVDSAVQVDQVSSKVSPIDPSLQEDSQKLKEAFRNTFVEIVAQAARSPDRQLRKVSPKDPEIKPKIRISEERTSNASRSCRSGSRTPKDSEKPKFDGPRRDRSASPRTERRRFTSPERRFSEKRRSSPSWRRRNSRSRSRSWSRSRSRSTDRRDRQKRFKYDERRERFSRSPRRGFNRDRRSDDRDWSLETSTDKTYDPLELLRGGKKPRECEGRKSGGESVPREGESQDLYENRLPSELGFNDRNYRDSLEREIMEGPIVEEPRSGTRYRRDRNSWDRRESPERFGTRKRSLERRPRSRLSPRSRNSPRRPEKGRFPSRSRSRSRSWTRSRSRSRTRSRSLTRSRSRSRSASRSRSSTRRRKSRSRSFSPRRRRRDDVRYRRSNSRDRVRQIETIVHPPGMNPPPPDEMSNAIDSSQASFRYETEDYFYHRNNLTYPPRMEESSGSPKRLSLDDRLELELGIKKQENAPVAAPAPAPYPPHFPMIPGSSPVPVPMRVPGPPGFHRPPTVVQVGNVLQVVPRDFQGSAGLPPPLPGARPDLPGPVGNGNRVLRVGNVLQVVPTPLDWNESPAMEVQVPPYPPPVPAVLPIPVPLPPPHPVTASPVPVPLPVPLPPVPVAPVAAPKPPPKPPVPKPVYNYEVIMEARRKEKEERRRLREERRAEKEKRRIIRMRKKAERAMEKVKKMAAAVEDAEDVPVAVPVPEDLEGAKVLAEEGESGGSGRSIGRGGGEGEDAKEYAGDEDEDEEVELEGEGDEDDEEEEEGEESEEEAEDEDSRVIPGLGDVKEVEENSQVKIEVESSSVLNVTVTPKKGILVPPGLWANRLINGDAGENEAELQESIEKLQFGEDDSEDSDDNLERNEEDKERRLNAARSRVRKSVQFADGIKPGEGTSPSGCEGDMPSPPPPASASLNDPMRDLVKRGRVKKILRKKTKRVKLPKTKKKVKVKIIKLKKPRITPLTELMLDDSDELDDRSPPPPPPGSPPPPHLWPSYLAAYSATLKPVDAAVSLPPVVQAVPPPTPLPLLVPPPPLNYTIQPLNKA